MASRDDLSKSVSKASAECFEYECTPCANDGRNIEAVKCCVYCVEYFCSLCLKHHDRYTKHHRTAEPSSMTRPSRQSGQRVVMETCHLHNDSTIDTYCVMHDVACCSTCVSLEHRACEGMKYIIDPSTGVFKSKEYNESPVMLDELLVRIKKLKKMKQEDQHNLEKEKTVCLQLIEDARRAVNKRLDDLETTAKDNVMVKYEEMNYQINQDVDDLDEMEAKLKFSKENLEKPNSDNESQAFARLKISRHHRHEGGDLFVKIKSTPKRGFLKFEINYEFQQFERTIESMGRPFVADSDEKLLRASFTGTHNIRIKSDTKVCSVGSYISLPDGEALISDFANNKIKKMNKSHEVSDWCDMPGQPGGMTNISPGEVAIALIEKEVIQFVTHNTMLKKSRSFKVGNRCRDVAFYDDMLYVTCGGGPNTSGSAQVAVYRLDGQLISSFLNDGNGQPMFTVPIQIITSSYSPVFKITDKRNGVISLDTQGKFKSSFTDKDLQCPRGICTANDGQLIVCGFESDNVIQLGKKGNMIGIILKKIDGISMPKCLYYDHTDSKLMVLMQTSDSFRVYKLTN